MIPLIAGTMLAIGALCFVLWPLMANSAAPGVSVVSRSTPPEYAVEALRELEFDRATGKISDSDYESLKARYTRSVLKIMRAGDRPVCERCGPRPEPDAAYCSSCGTSLAA